MLEISNNGEFAEMFKSRDPNSLYQSIEKIIGNSSHRNLLAKNSKVWATKNFTISNHIHQLKILYESIL